MIRQRGTDGIRLAFSLTELLISISLTALLASGMASSLFMAMKASGDDLGTVECRRGVQVADDLACELKYAKAFIEDSPSAVEFISPDQNGDSRDDRIRYEWSGVPGDAVDHR